MGGKVLKRWVTYKSAGGDIDAGNKFVEMIRPLVRTTFRPEVITDIGGFGGLFSFDAQKYKNPVLVSSARKVLFQRMGLKVTDREESLSATIGEALLVPTRIYVQPILRLLGDFHIHGIAHITGGGFTDNIPRMIPSGCKAVVRRNTWPVPPIFRVIQDGGKISEGEMLRTFNNGIGMISAVPPQEAKDIIIRLEGLNEKAYLVGEIIRAKAQERAIQFE